MQKKLKKKNFDLVVSSDCSKVKKICKKEKVFFLDRPKRISNDRASIHEVILHTIKNLKQNYEYIILLQPTSPLRNLDLVDKSIRILDNNKKFDSLTHLAKDFSFTGKVINNCWIPDYNLNKRSQEFGGKFLPTGNIYIYRSHLYKEKIKIPKKTFGLIDDKDKWIDIDNQKDLEVLNFFLKKQRNRNKFLVK